MCQLFRLVSCVRCSRATRSFRTFSFSCSFRPGCLWQRLLWVISCTFGEFSQSSVSIQGSGFCLKHAHRQILLEESWFFRLVGGNYIDCGFEHIQKYSGRERCIGPQGQRGYPCWEAQRVFARLRFSFSFHSLLFISCGCYLFAPFLSLSDWGPSHGAICSVQKPLSIKICLYPNISHLWNYS